MNKKIVIVVVLIILVVAIALLAPPITSKSPEQKNAIGPQASLAPTPRPTPLLKIDSNSDLSAESKKLSVPDYKSDYDSLDKTLSQF